MKAEFNALQQNHIWKLVSHDSTKNIVLCKWFLRIKKKRKANGSSYRYKVHLIAKGFTQQPKVEFHATFGPVVKSIVAEENMDNCNPTRTAVSNTEIFSTTDGAPPTDATHFLCVIAKMVLRYLRGTTHYGFCITRSDDFSLYTYLDADWVDDIDDRSSTSGAIFYSLALTRLLGHLKKQHIVARSSTKAEYCSVANVITKNIWG
ncbi:retrovirus-related pol polyprotein from transposon tnt 1-94 [Gossypium australe]|uniref:Retrovirus-related pol polyprotein from transposon tnt 1-94 n=1 Tax=Gossypium australe TaxID=47621 RepID=A0A5B6VE39_9ROSI|nr:retrovirus-related pol polyprotein from transposon tnt 1-94 [Gossypium australe]